MYLGIDIGTSSVKLILINYEQKILGKSEDSLSIINKKPLYYEQNPEDWYKSLLVAFNNLKTNVGRDIDQIISIGLTGQMHGAVCLDSKGDVVRPAILWNDGRSYKECDTLTKNNPEFETVSGNKVMPGFTAPKLLWIKNNEPDIFRKIHKVLLPKDYIRYRLTGSYSSDMSDASGTLWLDTKKREWSPSLLESCGLKESHMPSLQEGTECSSFVSSKMKTNLGLPIGKDIKVLAGASDNAAGSLSMGGYKNGQSVISLGTSAVYFNPTEKFIPNINRGLHTFCHAIQGMWHHMGVILSGASIIRWWKDINNAESEQNLINLSKNYNTDHVPIFLPYLSGERTPHNDPFAKGSFVGISHSTRNQEFSRSILEGIAFAIRDCEEAITSVSSIKQVSIIGGGARSFYWGEIISSILNRPLYYYNESILGPAFGAARLALYEDTSLTLRDVFRQPKITKVVEPNDKIKEELQKRFYLYRKTYSSLKDIFKELGA